MSPHEIASWLTYGGFGLMAASLAAITPLQVREFAILRERHPETYEALGSPRVARISMGQSFKLSEYARRKTYLHLGDPELTSVIRRKNRNGLLFFAGFGAVILGGVIHWTNALWL